MKRYLLLLIIFLIGCASTSKMVTQNIQRVELGDTKNEVVKKLGQPDQILSKELLSDGRAKTVWMYEAVKSKVWTGILRPTAYVKLAEEKAYQVQRLNNPPYLITFIDGKVTNLSRMNDP